MAKDIDQTEPPVKIPDSGNVTDRIRYCEQIENKLLADLFKAGSVEEQGVIKGKMDYVAGVIVRLYGAQQAVEQAGRVVTQHPEGGYTPHDRINALDVLMEEASAAGNVNEYKMYRVQRQDLVRKYGTPGHTTISSSRNPRRDDLRKIVNTYQSDECGADLSTRMEAAAQAGDMATYKELRKQRNQQHQA